MSCTISTSNESENVWMIQNSIYDRFMKILIERFGNEKDVTSCLTMSIYTNGISLDIISKEDPSLAMRLAEIMKVVAREKANGRYVLIDEEVSPISEMQKKCMSSFENLYLMLEAYTGCGPGTGNNR